MCVVYLVRQISFVVVAIVPTSVGIRGTEVQFLAGTAVVASFHDGAARRKNDL
ncbi:Uncharacterized protein DBV15_05037 [Temnothorax longispinosus]|uniref:Uncharacterized protein n=1 Tax=Temnothorax longispinosus TaxID=300112 RepID=A0A4S2KQB3_9HYME|nr:Uncharacterized protein DBV15_05037 [Temnothorax longispinosus]